MILSSIPTNYLNTVKPDILAATIFDKFVKGRQSGTIYFDN